MILKLEIIENTRLWSLQDMEAFCKTSTFTEDMFIEQVVNEKGYVNAGRAENEEDRLFSMVEDLTINLNTNEIPDILKITSARLGEGWITF